MEIIRRCVLLLLFFSFVSGAFAADGRNTDTSSYIEVDCYSLNHGESTFYFAALGQSNAANSSNSNYQSVTGAVYMVFEGKCYEAKDPLLGATGTGGSQWIKLADKLILEKGYTNVIIAASAVGGTSIAQWQPGSNLFTYSVYQMYSLIDKGFNLDAILWQQGESDTQLGTTMEGYYSMGYTMIAAFRTWAGIYSPVYVSRTSYCFGAASPFVVWAQGYLAETVWNTRLGPYTDALVNGGYRYDNCHFNDVGTTALADAWYSKLTAY